MPQCNMEVGVIGKTNLSSCLIWVQTFKEPCKFEWDRTEPISTKTTHLDSVKC